MRFNHMELTLPRGTLTEDIRAEIDAFYGEVFGWRGKPTEVVGQLCHLLLMDDGLFLLLAEGDKPMTSPGYDHLGVLLDSPEEVDEVRERCKRYQEKDDRVRIKEYDDLITPTVVCHAFYVRHLLPIWFDVQSLAPVT